MIKSDENDLSVLSGADCFISGSKTNSRGVAILIKYNFEYKIHDIQGDLDDNSRYFSESGRTNRVKQTRLLSNLWGF